MDLKNYQNFTLSNLCYLLPIKKFWTQTTIRPSIWLQFLSDHSQLYDFSSEMYRFVSTYMTKVCETSSTFSHNLHIWYYDILPNLIIFKLCLLFLKFLENSEMGCLPSAHPLALGKHLFAECQPLGTRQTTLFAECLFLPSVFSMALGK